jgi:hypothetical protein
MHLVKQSSKSKMLMVALCTLAGILCCSENSFAQKKYLAKNEAIIPFGIKDTASMLHITYDQILANPTLSCKLANCKVTSFTIGFYPVGGNYIGPYKHTGDRLREQILDSVKKLKELSNKDTRLFLEDIHVTINGEDKLLTPIVARCKR